jgi:hypothetical protein
LSCRFAATYRIGPHRDVSRKLATFGSECAAKVVEWNNVLNRTGGWTDLPLNRKVFGRLTAGDNELTHYHRDSWLHLSIFTDIHIQLL